MPDLLGLLDLQDSLVIQDCRVRRVLLGGLVQREPLVKQETLDGLEIPVHKVLRDHKETPDSRDQLEVLDRLVDQEIKDSLEMPARRVLLEALVSQAMLAQLALQVRGATAVIVSR